MAEQGKGVETPKTDASEEVIVKEPTTDASEEATTETTDASDEAPAEGTVPISEVRKLREEAKKYRLQLQEYREKSLKEKRDNELAEMKETDRLKVIAAEAEARASTLQQRADTVAKKAAIVGLAASMNFRDPQFVADAMNLDEIPISDSGIVDHSTVKQELDVLKETKSYLIRQENTQPPPSNFGGGPTNPSPPPGAQPHNPRLTDADKIADMKKRARDLIKLGKSREANTLQNRAWEMEHGIKTQGG